MNIKFGSNDIFPTTEIPIITIIVRVAFHENSKYYPQVFLDECLYKL